jgi:hypothetical protein
MQFTVDISLEARKPESWSAHILYFRDLSNIRYQTFLSFDFAQDGEHVDPLILSKFAFRVFKFSCFRDKIFSKRVHKKGRASYFPHLLCLDL